MGSTVPTAALSRTASVRSATISAMQLVRPEDCQSRSSRRLRWEANCPRGARNLVVTHRRKIGDRRTEVRGGGILQIARYCCRRGRSRPNLAYATYDRHPYPRAIKALQVDLIA
jgi:hypothetical protein